MGSLIAQSYNPNFISIKIYNQPIKIHGYVVYDINSKTVFLSSPSVVYYVCIPRICDKNYSIPFLSSMYLQWVMERSYPVSNWCMYNVFNKPFGLISKSLVNTGPIQRFVLFLFSI